MTTLKALMISLFGTYTPTTYTNMDNIDVIPDGIAGLDIVWIAGFLLFALTFYCIMRLLGGVISGIKRN